MPIKLPRALPAFDVLSDEGVMVMADAEAARQDIRPLRIGLVNLMPKKVQTETQFARVIGATPLQIEFSLIRMTGHESRNTAPEHMEAFYRPFSEAKHEKFDGVIITGAPIEHLEFDEVSYIDELRELFAWTQNNVHSTFGVCWGGMAMINHFHGVKKHILTEKAFGCFRHQNLDPASPYLRGFSDDFVMPVSRWTEMRVEEISAVEDLHILMSSDEVGVGLVADPRHRALYIFNHLEYDSTTLMEEYQRDVEAGGTTLPPINYFRDDDPQKTPENRWRSHGHLLYGNWVNEIYQTSPFDMNDIGK